MHRKHQEAPLLRWQPFQAGKYQAVKRTRNAELHQVDAHFGPFAHLSQKQVSLRSNSEVSESADRSQVKKPDRKKDFRLRLSLTAESIGECYHESTSFPKDEKTYLFMSFNCCSDPGGMASILVVFCCRLALLDLPARCPY